MPTWVQTEAARKEKYPESSDGNMLLKKDEEETNEPIECQRVMIQRIRDCQKMKINSPEDVVKLLKELKDYDRERAIILSLDTKNNVVSIENISTGSLNASIVHPREAIKGSLLVNAANIIFAHNHPSGDPMPSAEDKVINKKLQEAFNIVGVNMLDSIIIGRDGYYSAREHGEMFPESKYKEAKPESGGMKIMEHKRNEIEPEEDDACTTAMTAAMSVIGEQCIGGKIINNVLQAANAATQYIADKKGYAVFAREIQRINKVDEDTWEVDIDSPKFKGRIKISAGEAEIVRD